MLVVLRLGHILFTRELDMELWKGYREVLMRFLERGNKGVIVTGGGEIAREQIKKARLLNLDWSLCDEIGIMCSRIHALLLYGYMKERAMVEFTGDLQRIANIARENQLVITGGMFPGQSTDAVAALIAERVGADLVIKALDVGGVYDKDPKKYPEAKLLKKISAKKLWRMISTEELQAGGYKLLDPIALKVLERSQIPIIFIDGRDVKSLEKVFQGEDVGTRVIYT